MSKATACVRVRLGSGVVDAKIEGNELLLVVETTPVPEEIYLHLREACGDLTEAAANAVYDFSVLHAIRTNMVH